jgi:hypothetical protein
MRSSPQDVIYIRSQCILAGKPLPRERFKVFRVERAGLPNEYHEEFWSFDTLEPSNELCKALVTDIRGAYVLDTATGKNLLDLKAKGCR